MTKFKRSPKTNPYTIITPDTTLADLEGFLKNHIFALSTYLLSELEGVARLIVFVLVTDYERKFVLGVATSHDLEVNFCLAQSGSYSHLIRSYFNADIRLSTRHLASTSSDLDYCTTSTV